MSAFLRSNAGLVAWLGLFTITTVVLSLCAYFMHSRGLSLKPVWWFAGCMLIVGFPQFVYHGYVAYAGARAGAGAEGSTASAAVRPTLDPEKLFTTPPDGAVAVDIPSQGAPGVFGKAEQARLVTMPNGDTVMLARFASSAGAAGAVGDYMREAGLEAGSQPDGAGGFIVPGIERRSARVYAKGNDLIVHTTMESPSAQPARVDPMSRWTASTKGKLIAASVVLVYTLFFSVFFLKGAAWATRIDARAVERVLSASELRQRLLALNTPEIPFQIEEADNGELSAIWKYADAKWVDLARAHGMRRIHRIRLSFDEAARMVRATDYQSSYDWSAGAGGGGIAWKASTGIVLFQYEHQRVYGLQLDKEGRGTPQFSYSYTFDLQEMKSPLIEAVTGGGWRWQPVAWQAPPSLRWFTE